MIFTRRFIHLPDLFKVLMEYSSPEFGTCRPINFKLSNKANSNISSYSEIKKDGYEVDLFDKENFWIEVTLQHTTQYDHDKFMQSEYGVKGTIIQSDIHPRYNPCPDLSDSFLQSYFKFHFIPVGAHVYIKELYWI